MINKADYSSDHIHLDTYLFTDLSRYHQWFMFSIYYKPLQFSYRNDLQLHANVCHVQHHSSNPLRVPSAMRSKVRAALVSVKSSPARQSPPMLLWRSDTCHLLTIRATLLGCQHVEASLWNVFVVSSETTSAMWLFTQGLL